MRRRREFVLAPVTALTAVGMPFAVGAATRTQTRAVEIGIIGAGRIGGTLGELWVKAGHEVLLSSRHPDELRDVVEGLGPSARAGTPKAAAAFGDVILISVPYAALPQIGRDLAGELKGKVVLDTCNPIPRRDGEKIAIPLAADDQEAVKIALRLVTDAGFEPVVVGRPRVQKSSTPERPSTARRLPCANCGTRSASGPDGKIPWASIDRY